MSDVALFDVLKRWKRRWAGKGLTQAEVNEINSALRKPVEATPAPSVSSTVSDALPGVKGTLAAIVGTLAATSLFTMIPKEEGMEYKAYRDIVGVLTICAGDTKDVRAGLIETPEGCRIRLERQLIAHAKPVMACTPRLSEPGRDWQRAAAVSLAYNVGVGAWCRSTADKRFDAGDWRGGCDAFLRWNKAGGREIRGLTLRRQRERALCLKGLS